MGGRLIAMAGAQAWWSRRGFIGGFVIGGAAVLWGPGRLSEGGDLRRSWAVVD